MTVEQHEGSVDGGAGVSEPRVRVRLRVEPAPLRGGKVKGVRVPEDAVLEEDAAAVDDPVGAEERGDVIGPRRR